jgi:broad specificity phosphatase PhoE
MLEKLPSPPSGWYRILLIRHGETIANEKGLLQGSRVDGGLNEKGQIQAQKLAQYINTRFNVGVVLTTGL